jgi:hypothetical protein
MVWTVVRADMPALCPTGSRPSNALSTHFACHMHVSFFTGVSVDRSRNKEKMWTVIFSGVNRLVVNVMSKRGKTLFSSGRTVTVRYSDHLQRSTVRIRYTSPHP